MGFTNMEFQLARKRFGSGSATVAGFGRRLRRLTRIAGQPPMRGLAVFFLCACNLVLAVQLQKRFFVWAQVTFDKGNYEISYSAHYHKEMRKPRRVVRRTW